MNNFDFIQEEVSDFGGMVSLKSTGRMITATISWDRKDDERKKPVSGKPSSSVPAALLTLDMALQLNFVQVESKR